MNESEQTPITEWGDLSASEAALLAQTARLSPEERYNVLLFLWSFWHAVGGTAQGPQVLPEEHRQSAALNRPGFRGGSYL